MCSSVNFGRICLVDFARTSLGFARSTSLGFARSTSLAFARSISLGQLRSHLIGRICLIDFGVFGDLVFTTPSLRRVDENMLVFLRSMRALANLRFAAYFASSLLFALRGLVFTHWYFLVWFLIPPRK
jgi:hypothetical protein